MLTLIPLMLSGSMNLTYDVDSINIFRGYLNYGCTICLLASILVGVIFAENAIARPYTKSMKFVQVIRYYGIRAAIDNLMWAGALLLAFSVVVNCVIRYVPGHAATMAIIFSVIALGICVYASFIGNSTTKSQVEVAKHFQDRFCDSNGSLKPDLLSFVKKEVAKKEKEQKDFKKALMGLVGSKALPR